jgi:hypothetical protein
MSRLEVGAMDAEDPDGSQIDGGLMLAWGSRRLRMRDDEGSTLIEVTVAAMVMAVGVTGLMGSIGAGMGLVGHSRQRSTGSSVANERIENAHNIPYDQLGLNVAPTHTNDVTHPDSRVTTDGRYEVKDNAPGLCATADLCEKIHVGGTYLHVEDPYSPPGNSTVFRVHQYVTWVEDSSVGDTEPTIVGTQSYKRVTVVVTWKFPVATGRTTTVTLSTFVSRGGVTVPQVSATPSASPSASPSQAPVPSAPPIDPSLLGIGQYIPGSFTPPQTNPANPCPTDFTGPSSPSVLVVSGSGTEQGYLSSTTTSVKVRATDTCTPMTAEFSNTSADAGFQPATTTMPSATDTTVSWIIPNGDGTKTFWTRFKDNQGNFSGTFITYVILDLTKPTVPANFVKSSCSISGSYRAINFTWSPSTDTNLSGYRLYKKIENGAFQIKVVVPNTTLTASDNDKRSFNSMQFKVRAFDKAGNESNDSTVVTFTKNVC